MDANFKGMEAARRRTAAAARQGRRQPITGGPVIENLGHVWTWVKTRSPSREFRPTKRVDMKGCRNRRALSEWI